MIFAEFYQYGCVNKDKLIPACGDRAVIILDGRHNLGDNANLAREECKKRGYKGFKICKGTNFVRDVVTIRELEVLCKEDKE